MAKNNRVPYQPSKLIISGGGPKGRAYIPVINILHETSILPEIKDVYGSSVGGLLAGMLCLGFTPHEIEQKLMQDSSVISDLYRTKPLVSTLKTPFRVMKNMFKNKAYYKGDKLFQEAQEIVATHFGSPNATFADLRIAVQQQKSHSQIPFRNLHVTATVCDSRGLYQIILNAETAPNMPIALALRMTAALPGAFPSVVITPQELKKYTRGATKPLVQYDRGKPFVGNEVSATMKNGNIELVDGGFVDNLPQYLVQKSGEANLDVLSLKLSEPNYLSVKNKTVDSLKSKHITDTQEKQFLLKQKPTVYRRFVEWKKHQKKARIPPSRLLATADTTIDINTEEVSSFDFNLSSKQHDLLIRNGYLATCHTLDALGVDLRYITPLSTQSPPPHIISEAELNEISAEAQFLLKSIKMSKKDIPHREDIKSLTQQERAHYEESGDRISLIKHYYSEIIRVDKKIDTFLHYRLNHLSHQDKILLRLCSKHPQFNQFLKSVAPDKQKRILALKPLLELQDLDFRLKSSLKMVRLQPADRKRRNAPSLIQKKPSLKMTPKFIGHHRLKRKK